jgi:superfamily II RNA helicase
MVLTTDNNNYSNDAKYGEYFGLFQHELSPFQKHAIQAIVDGNHVLVTAATGSGKTLPAEFAIRHFTGLGKRVIYCSPIKALSNQKTYDFTHKYPDITFGLLTGDIKTNPSAQVLIMTTEILMNKLFAKETTEESSLSFTMDIERELGCVIFDELHYINDAHRGHVWEQSILMMPAHVQMVMLSATLDDPVKFAGWVEGRVETDSCVATDSCVETDSCEATDTKGRVETDSCVETEKKQVVICSTDKRVVPLTHYIYMNGTEGLYKKLKDKETESRFRKSFDKCLPIRSADGVFNESTYKEAKTILDSLSANDIHMKRKNVLNNLFAHLRDNEMLPAICFVFSRKAVEQCAEEITVPLLEDDSKVSYTVRYECESIIKRLPNWREYQSLPEYHQLVALLEKGIGIHHSGMIPVLREIVEFMISKKYIKVLFATESFAIGLDCPIKTAVFINLKKYDGGDQPRYLLPHEYTQMAGRAGRRGIDTVGHVVHCSNLFELPSMTTYKEVLCGTAQKLTSKFQIYYPVVLNLFKNLEHVSTEDIERFIENSMLQKEIDSVLGGLKRESDEISKKIANKEQGFANLKTQREILKEYSDLQVKLEFSANKKRKEIDTTIRKMFATNANLEKDYVFYMDYLRLKKSLEETNHCIRANENFVYNRVQRLLQVLVHVGVIRSVGEDKYTLVSHFMSEINPILIAHLCNQWNYFADFGAEDLVAFFSIFTDVRVHEESRIYSPYSDNSMMDEKLKSFVLLKNDLLQIEEKHGIQMKDSGLDDFCYDMVDTMYEWCACKDENDCKNVIAEIEERGVSVGDFTKAVLKISTICRELMSICENVELMRKLTEVDKLVLKYVATNQSLYL